MAFTITDNSNTITLYPNWDVAKGDRLIQGRTPSLTGEENEYIWANRTSFIYIFPLNNVPICDAIVINSWWLNQTALQLLSELDGHFILDDPVWGILDGPGTLFEPNTYRIVGRQEPFTSFSIPYQNEVVGTLQMRLL